ncbi:thiopurine S-methyltransferase [Azoarcus sp. KH32C]|uniref:thiopurine S-methyltransferase n=1 Tax=Azoarcus sp. KH32C TaxID=748247 RepID=UPI0002385D3F|nr:thiopurine S-methyltransferase [Azoarcus sp. KH32C]BAL27520.1 thiopurine S-methyltransferase family protein [Azoarcus sp. KH32C]
MDASFWHAKWEKNEIGFHQDQVNPFLIRYFGELSLSHGSRVFVPLCGKTRDIAWLLSQGYRVAGAELSRVAIEQLFAEFGVEPRISEAGSLTHFAAQDIDIHVGDIFELAAKDLGQVDAVYDRAALVALPEDMRRRYANHLAEITNRAPQLLITYEYDQAMQDGPPFSVSGEEVRRHYEARFDVALVDSADVPGGLRGKCPAKEHAWVLKKT